MKFINQGYYIYVQGLQLMCEMFFYYFSILAFTESVNRALMKKTRPRTHVSALFGHEGFFSRLYLVQNK